MKDAKRSQKRIISCVRSYILYLGKSPTFKEIAKSTGLDVLTAYVATTILIDKGLLARIPDRKNRYVTLPH